MLCKDNTPLKTRSGRRLSAVRERLPSARYKARRLCIEVRPLVPKGFYNVLMNLKFPIYFSFYFSFYS